MLVALLTASPSHAQSAALGGESAAAHDALDEAYRLLHAGQHQDAEAAFRRALDAGADAQVAWFELGNLAARRGDRDAAQTAYEHARQGKDPELGRDAERALSALEPAAQAGSTPAPSSNAATLLELAYRQKAAHDPAHAEASFEAAARAGADPQLVALELAYLALERSDTQRGRQQLLAASRGPDAARSAQAQKELASLGTRDPITRTGWADIYAEAFGWTRRVGATHESDLVPTLRVRGFATLSQELDLHLYLFGQITRDAASRSAGASGLPLIYADNSAIVGPGMLLRLWQRRIGLFAQVGPALELVDQSKRRVSFDARAGLHLGLESKDCWPAAQGDSRWRFVSCEELYGEATYVSRYQHDVIAFLRGRASLSVAVTGPLEWQLTGELRAGADTNGEYYNNFVDAGLGPRLRLLAPIRLDLMFAPHVGSYLGRHHLDPLPSPTHYVDLRAQAATYIEL